MCTRTEAILHYSNFVEKFFPLLTKCGGEFNAPKNRRQSQEEKCREGIVAKGYKVWHGNAKIHLGVVADYRSYVGSQEQVSLTYEDEAKWTQMSILNVARMGKFSSDRSIKEYCDKIWKAHPLPVELGKYKIE